MARKLRSSRVAVLDRDLSPCRRGAGELDARRRTGPTRSTAAGDRRCCRPPDSSAGDGDARGRSSAPVQCSTAVLAPDGGSYQAAQSPTATTPARLVRPSAPQRTPLSSASPEPCSQSMLGTRADPDEDEVGGQPAAVGEHRTAVDPVAAARAGATRCRTAAHAVVGVQGGRRRRPSRPERAGSGRRRASTTVTSRPRRVGGGGDLGADETGADHHEPAAAGTVRRAGRGRRPGCAGCGRRPGLRCRAACGRGRRSR